MLIEVCTSCVVECRRIGKKATRVFFVVPHSKRPRDAVVMSREKSRTRIVTVEVTRSAQTEKTKERRWCAEVVDLGELSTCKTNERARWTDTPTLKST
ncbi:hypothetical protein Taro_041285 [Colocasia esculenta]|uniref:Uncharacterized protein n=1 Tax=Colocasia esculenta TaxID=4460 RepID=A0A843X079_COLES|nr:hypothetical protein [Colocasia esculenta]